MGPPETPRQQIDKRRRQHRQINPRRPINHIQRNPADYAHKKAVSIMRHSLGCFRDLMIICLLTYLNRISGKRGDVFVC